MSDGRFAGFSIYPRRAPLVVTMLLALVSVARSGHELPIYPSYYPHEIELAAVTPERAADLLASGKLQAYVGSAPLFAASPPGSIARVESLGSFVAVRVNPASPALKDGKGACALGDAIIRNFAGKSSDVILHPYPVTPLHGDYLLHVDLAEAAKAHLFGNVTDPSLAASPVLTLKVGGERLQSLVLPEWRAQGPEWDAEVVEVEVNRLIDPVRHSLNGWLGPSWVKAGWFHAYLLLHKEAGDDEVKRRIEGELRRLQTAADNDDVERVNRERSLVMALADNCHLRIAGYSVRREYFSTVFTAGIENIAYDAIDGFNSPIFVRTVKLKDFPWNGWLALGVDGTPGAAWNPIAGFTDNFGRLMWAAVGDPASIPSPYESAWMLNRITNVQSSAKH
jgi:hypothetical protein